MVRVQDLLEGLDVRLLCGEAGLGAPVRWVHISELADPTPWLSGGEVLLSTGMALSGPDEQRAYVERLADHGVAALGFGTGIAHDTVPAPLLEVAQARGFPVFEIPYAVPFLAITESAFTRLVSEEYAVVRQALAAQERLERIVLAERGLGALAAALAEVIDGSVLVLDPRGDLLAGHDVRRGRGEPAVAELARQVRAQASGSAPRVYMEHGAGLVLEVPGGGDHSGEGWLVAARDAGPLSDFHRLTLRWAVTLIGLELLRARVAGETERRLAGDVMASLAAGELRGAELARRLEPFGLGERVAVMALDGPEEDGLREALRAEVGACLVACLEGRAWAIVPAPADAEAAALAQRVGERLADRRAMPVRIGLGRGMGAADARRSLHEARYALETLKVGTPVAAAAGARSNGAPQPVAETQARVRVATHRDIGAFALLLSLHDDESLRVFCDTILEPIETSQGAYSDELIRSLEAFIEENGQWERAAKRLDCHRHTLRYRIRRIEELTGRELDSARDRIDFWLALRGRELVR